MKYMRMLLLKVSRPLALLLGCALLLGLTGVPSAFAASNTTIRCNIPRVGYGNCSSDNVAVKPGHKVFIALNSSGGKSVHFRLFNRNGHHLLAQGPDQKPGQGFFFLWTNNTRSTITTDVMADAGTLLRVSAVATLRVT